MGERMVASNRRSSFLKDFVRGLSGPANWAASDGLPELMDKVHALMSGAPLPVNTKQAIKSLSESITDAWQDFDPKAASDFVDAMEMLVGELLTPVPKQSVIDVSLSMMRQSAA